MIGDVATHVSPCAARLPHQEMIVKEVRTVADADVAGAEICMTATRLLRTVDVATRVNPWAPGFRHLEMITEVVGAVDDVDIVDETQCKTAALRLGMVDVAIHMSPCMTGPHHLMMSSEVMLEVADIVDEAIWMTAAVALTTNMSLHPMSHRPGMISGVVSAMADMADPVAVAVADIVCLAAAKATWTTAARRFAAKATVSRRSPCDGIV